MNRRGFLGAALPAAAGFAAMRAKGTALASPAVSAAPASLTTIALTPQLLLIRGGGGNVTVFDSPQGVLMVDGGSPAHSAQVLQQVRQHTGASRITVLFNTHWHWDHTGSNPTLGPAGSRIIAHENTRLWLGARVVSQWQHRTFEPLPRQARPNQTFYTTGSLSFGGEQIDYGYLPQAHTDGDIYVYFRHANVLVAGDVLSVGSYPILDYSTNGWIGGMVNATQTLIGLANEDTRLIPGTGPVQSRADLAAEHEMLSVVKVRLSQLLAQGMSVQDMLAAAPTREFDARWGDPTLLISNAWPGLVQRARELGVHIV